MNLAIKAVRTLLHLSRVQVAAMMIFSRVISRVGITPEYFPRFIESLHSAFIPCTIFRAIGIGAPLMRGRRQPPAAGVCPSRPP